MVIWICCLDIKYLLELLVPLKPHPMLYVQGTYSKFSFCVTQKWNNSTAYLGIWESTFWWPLSLVSASFIYFWCFNCRETSMFVCHHTGSGYRILLSAFVLIHLFYFLFCYSFWVPILSIYIFNVGFRINLVHHFSM